MAKNKWVKWAVGLSGVLVFTGFVGMTKQVDMQNGSTVPTTGDQSNTTAGSIDQRDAVLDEWVNQGTNDANSTNQTSGWERHGHRGGEWSVKDGDGTTNPTTDPFLYEEQQGNLLNPSQAVIVAI